MTETAFPHPQRERSAATHFLRVRVGLLLYGLVAASYAALHLLATLPATLTMESGRAAGAAQAIEGMNRGAPALVGYADGRFVPVGLSDDYGFFVYAAFLGRLFHVGDPLTILRGMYVSSFALAILVLPLIAWELFGSFLVAAIAPLFVIREFTFLNDQDIYWVNGLVLLLLVPVLWLVYSKPWTRWSIATLVATMLAASVASSMRVNAGLPVLVSALLVVLLKQRGWLRRSVIAAGLVVAYLLVSPLAFVPMTRARDAYLNSDVTKIYPSQHVAWHNMYIGLGYVPNPYGIYWLDAVGVHKARAVDPDVVPNSRAYVTVMRKLYLSMVVHHPGFVLRSTWAKTKVVLARGYLESKGLLVVVPLMLVFGRRGRQFRAYALLTLPALLIDALPPILTVPYPNYALGWAAAIGLYALLAAIWLVLFVTEDVPNALDRARPEDVVRRLPRSLGAATTWLRPQLRSRWLAPAASTAFAVLLVASAVPASAAEAKPATARQAGVTFPWKPSPGLGRVAAAPPAGVRIVDWQLGAGLPADWTVQPDVSVNAVVGGTRVDTSRNRADYQVLSPKIVLRQGRYAVLVRGDIQRGGINLGALDARRSAWAGQSHYWFKQHTKRGTMAARFTLKRPATVRLVLANWRQRDISSRWIISRIAVIRLGS